MKKLNALTSLRFFAAMAIVLEHARGTFMTAQSLPNLLYSYGVSFFFVLSGFILTSVYRDQLNSISDVLRYYAVRIGRIWPLHVLTLLLVILSVPSNFRVVGGETGSGVFLANLFLVQAWIPMVKFYYSYNAASWSISAEMFFYLLLPFLLHRWSSTWLWKSLVVMAVVSTILTVTTMLRLPDFDLHEPLAVSVPGFSYVSPYVRIAEFVIGMLAANVFSSIIQRAPRSIVLWTAIEVASVLLIVLLNRCVTGIFGHDVIHTTWKVFIGSTAAVPAFFVVILAAAMQRGLFSRLLNFKPLVVLGNASFALYMIHQVVLGFISLHHDDYFAGIADGTLFCGYLVTVLVLSLVLWRGVEEPCRNLVKRLAFKSRPAPQKLPTPSAEASSGRL